MTFIMEQIYRYINKKLLSENRSRKDKHEETSARAY
jgi:hypothetical protein